MITNDHTSSPLKEIVNAQLYRNWIIIYLFIYSLIYIYGVNVSIPEIIILFLLWNCFKDGFFFFL